MAPSVQFSSVTQSCPTLRDPMTEVSQASLSITKSRSLLKLMSIESVMPSNHLILCYPLLLQPPIFPSIRVFSNESVLHIRWPKDWSFSLRISLSNEYSGLISLKWTGWISLQSKGLSRVFSSTTVQKHQFFIAYISLNWISPTFKAKSIDLKLNQCYKIKNRKVSIKVATKILIVIFPEWAQLSCCYGLFT